MGENISMQLSKNGLGSMASFIRPFQLGHLSQMVSVSE